VTRSDPVATAFVNACFAELEALKPGNVHRYRAGHRMQISDFIRSAEAAAGPLVTPGASVGLRILKAVEATLNAVQQNTNLGIILLCAPLAAAMEDRTAALRPALATVLNRLDRQDAEFAFQAIARAAPAGLGQAPRHDVFSPAHGTLLEAMAEARGRDRIARQYACGFADIFDTGLTTLHQNSTRWEEPQWRVVVVYLTFLSRFEDSHIQRKFGSTIAVTIRCQAEQALEHLLACQDPAAIVPELLGWDQSLKERRINPGTSADLTVATLFADQLEQLREAPSCCLPPTVID
jgi:triphosphoribosyl-dephospho-CoA synthase